MIVVESGSLNAASVIYHHNKSILDIPFSCNKLKLIMLYVGFIICLPSRFWRKVRYILF